LTASATTTEVELVQIVRETGWRGIQYDRNSPPSPHNYPIARGTYLPLDKREALLWTQGSVVGVHVENPKYNVYKEGALRPTPAPILLRRFSGVGGWHDTCAGILGLTKMDWNNNNAVQKASGHAGLLEAVRRHHPAESEHG